MLSETQLAEASYELEWNQTKSISMDKLKEYPEFICLFSPAYVGDDVSWLYYWMLQNKFEYFLNKNSIKCLLSRENVISLLSVIINVVKNNNADFSKENLPEICLGYRKPYDLNYYEKLRFFYNTVIKKIKQTDRNVEQFLLIINY